ncbi:MAG TPA: bacillithiol system redox-active protein YtxJ [Flavobacteriales bacterium]|nr:bacillithiol system redox-active protein YtxJ [Flavobacteriales bacterium]
MGWKKIESEDDLSALDKRSYEVPQLIFKHSTRCGISNMALDRMQRAQQPSNLEIHYLDLLKFRPISNKIATDYCVHHESPQVLLIQNGHCVYHASHSEINMETVLGKL